MDVIRFLLFADSLWRHISTLTNKNPDLTEQMYLNNALIEMNAVWQKSASQEEMCAVREGWEGQGDDGIRFYVFPPHVFCRAKCCTPTMATQDTLYCAHPRAPKHLMNSKEAELNKMEAWFL